MVNYCFSLVIWGGPVDRESCRDVVPSTLYSWSRGSNWFFWTRKGQTFGLRISGYSFFYHGITVHGSDNMLCWCCTSVLLSLLGTVRNIVISQSHPSIVKRKVKLSWPESFSEFELAEARNCQFIKRSSLVRLRSYGINLIKMLYFIDTSYKIFANAII